MHACANIGKMPSSQKILISRTDGIGDVCLTLPVCRALRSEFPNAELVFLCREYTKAVLAKFDAIDSILLLEDLENLQSNKRREVLGTFSVVLHLYPNRRVAFWCKQARIRLRIGTAHRWHHWFYCNARPRFSRFRSDLHEAQLNFKLLTPLGIEQIPSWDDIQKQYFTNTQKPIQENLSEDLSLVILLHPKSHGNGLEYPIEKYMSLAQILTNKGYKVYFTGTEKEGLQFRDQIPQDPNIFDATGLWDLATFIANIAKAKALVACSTGPYHLAGLSGIRAIGLFEEQKPIHPGRWASLGPKAHALAPLQLLTPQEIADVIEK